MTFRHPAHTVIVTSTLLILGLAGCSERVSRPPEKPTGELQPGADTQPQAASTRPAEATQPAPAATKPATQPAGPVSKFSSEPPYPVELFVRSPKEEQPGWLKILELGGSGHTAVARGVFPEQNVMIVDTENVKRLQIHVGYLPMSAKKRIVLRIDNQGMELNRRNRYITLERRPTGEWAAVRK